MILGTVGLPRSGKSTFVSKIMDRRNFAIVSRDSIRLNLYGHRFFQPGESMVKAISETMFRSLVDRGCDIILDETNLNIDARYYWQKLVKEKIFWIHVNTKSEKCKERAIITSQSELVPIIESMEKSFEKPHKDEGVLVTIDENCNFSPYGYNILSVRNFDDFMERINNFDFSIWKDIIEKKFPD